MIYQAFLNHLQSNEYDNGSTQLTDSKNNLEFVDYKLRLRVNYIFSNEISKTMIDEFIKWQHDEDPPSAIVVSCTYANYLRGNLTDGIQKAFSQNLTRLVKPINEIIAKNSKVLWKLQDPIDPDKLSEDWKNLKNDDVDKYNQAVYDVLGYSNVHIWASSKLIASGLLDETIDGYRLGPLALRHDVQILLNMYCNDYMNYNDGTCCSSAETYTIIQVITYAVFGIR